MIHLDELILTVRVTSVIEKFSVVGKIMDNGVIRL